MLGNIFKRNKPSGFQQLVQNHSRVDARKKRNIASQRHEKFKQEAEKHQQQVYEYIKEGANRSEAERLPLAMEAKIAQFNAVVARVRSFKGLKNQLVWRMVEVRNSMPDPEDLTDDEVDVQLGEMQGEMSQITDEFQHWNASVQSELTELMDVLNSFDFQNGSLEIEADDMLQQMEDFDSETTADDLGHSMGLSINQSTTTVDTSTTGTGVGDAVDADADVDTDGAISIDSALEQMEAVADQVDNGNNS